MVEAYKILKSLMKNIKRLVMHLGTNQNKQASLPAIANLVTEALSAITSDGDLATLLSTYSKKDQTSFVASFSGLSQIE